MNIFKFKILKFFISPLFSLLIFIRSSNLLLSIIVFLFLFFIPNFLIYTYKKNESLKIINDLSEICNGLKLALSCNIPLHEALKFVKHSIKYKRFRDSFDIFLNDYIMYNFNMIKAVDNFKLKFNSYEFNMFLNILLQCEKEGKIIESLTIFIETLDLAYFKYLKYKEAKRIIFVTFASIISLINITILTLYPIVKQITENLQNILG